MTQSGSMHVATGGGSGKVSVQDIHITKMVDKSTPILTKFCCTGQHFATGTLTVCKAGGTSPVEYLKLKMEKIIISSYNTGGSEGAETVTESVSLNFGKYTLTYTPQSATGDADAAVEQTWDIAVNKTF